VTAADVRAQLARGLNRRGAARALGVPIGVVHALLREDLTASFVRDHGFREVAARGRVCAACGHPAVDICGGRPLCRSCLSPDDDLAEVRAEAYGRLGSALGELSGPMRDGLTRTNMKAFRRDLDAACERRGIPSEAPRGVLFGRPLEERAALAGREE
jgi:hypothetical protein